MLKNVKTGHLIGLTMFVIVVVVIIIGAFAKGSPKTEDFCYENTLLFKNYMEKSLRDDMDSRGMPYELKITMVVDKCQQVEKIVTATYTTEIKSKFTVFEDGGSREIKVCATAVDTVTLTQQPDGKIGIDHLPVSEVVEECPK